MLVCGRMNNKREVLEDRRRCESRGRKDESKVGKN